MQGMITAAVGFPTRVRRWIDASLMNPAKPSAQARNRDEIGTPPTCYFSSSAGIRFEHQRCSTCLPTI